MIEGSGVMVENAAGDTHICIAHPNRCAHPETFVEAHIRHLPARVHIVHGDWSTESGVLTADRDGSCRPLVSSSQRLLGRFLRGVKRMRLPARTAPEALSGPSPDLMTGYALEKFLRAGKISAVLAEYGMTGVSVMDACMRAQVPLVVHFHGYDAHSKAVLDTYAPSYKKLFDRAAAVVAVSRKMEQQLEHLGAPQEKIYYNVCGVDIDRFKKTDPGTNPPLFVAVGRFVDKKAPHLSLLAFQKVLAEIPVARLRMIGEGPLLESCKQLARALGISHAVDFTGPRAHSDVAKAMQEARCFVQHSVTAGYGDSEGTPVAILEAGASGLPVVATRHAGIVDAVIENKTGYLVDEFDVDQMAQYMLRLAEEPQRAREIGTNARKHVEEKYSLSKSITGLWDIIQKCIT